MGCKRKNNLVYNKVGFSISLEGGG